MQDTARAQVRQNRARAERAERTSTYPVPDARGGGGEGSSRQARKDLKGRCMEDEEFCDRAQTTAEEELLGGAVRRSWPATPDGMSTHGDLSGRAGGRANAGSVVGSTAGRARGSRHRASRRRARRGVRNSYRDGARTRTARLRKSPLLSSRRKEVTPTVFSAAFQASRTDSAVSGRKLLWDKR